MQYEPLDKTKNEIRVLEFLDLSSPVSTEDIIQCSVRNVSLPSSFDSQLHQKGSQKRKFPIAWDKFTKSVDLRDSTLEQTRLNAAVHAGLHRRYPQCNGSRYDWGDFEALSYTWGNTGDTKTIQINGVRKSVPHNLEAALRALRNLEETLLGMCYWIDSLCIDQENIEERNEQVKRMQEIYGRARAVIVWLGQEEEMDRIAIQIMHDPDPPTDLLRSEWPTLFAFTQKSYWNRCWIIQELAMNHNSTLFLCGQFKLTRKMTKSGAFEGRIFSYISEDYNYQTRHKVQLDASAMFDRMSNLIDFTPDKGIGEGAESLLDLVRGTKATDERDKIYSILGLLDPAISADVTPNYSLSVQQVYTDFMKSAIKGSRRLNQIVFGSISAEQGWPSWVPDWRKPPRRFHDHTMIFHYASSVRPAKFRFIEKERNRIFLSCSGFHVDTVDGIAAEPPLDSYATRSSAVSDRYSGRTLEAIGQTFIMGNPTVVGRLLFTVPWNLSRDTDDSIANILLNPKWLRTFHFHYFERWDKFRRYNKDFCISGQKFRTLFAPPDEHSLDIGPTLDALRYTVQCLDRRVFITTRTGYVGLAPVETRPGDVVAILLGCRWPLVLRLCNSGFYQLVGECYIHGLMDGEIFDQKRDGHVSEREFILC